jgi:hypothetical protein
MGRKPLYITTGRAVTDPLTGAGFSVTSIVINMRQYAIIIIRSRSCSVGITVNTFFVSRNTTLAPPRDEDGHHPD